MIKRLIFDLDNTLITWEKEYDNIIKKVLDDLGYENTQELSDQINKIELEYEKDRRYFNKEEMLKFFNEKLDQKLPETFIDQWLKLLPNCVPDKLPKEDYETLEYLSKKYELVILTNWFGISQVERLKKVDILKYFKEIYDAEKYAKPYKESFYQAMGDKNADECAVIGDDIIMDIQAAKNVGIKNLVWKDNNNTANENKHLLEGVIVIKKLQELKGIL